MELFQDISNNPQLPGTQQQPVLKTFERRRRVASIPEDSTTAAEGDEAASPCSSSASPSTNVLQDGCCASDIPSTAAGALSKRGRRSSVLRAAALPGHRLFSSSVQASRSLLLAKMSKARRKAYLAYTQQMAEYFAEVDQFELVVESPAAATDKQARSRVPPPHASAAGTKLKPTAWERLQAHSSRHSTAETPASATADTPAESALLSATPGSAAPSAVSSQPDASLLASPVSPLLLAAAAAAADNETALGGSEAAGPRVPATATAAVAHAEPANERSTLQQQPQQEQQEHAQQGSSTTPGRRSSSGARGAALLADTPLQQASLAGADWLPLINSSLGRLSLASSTPAGDSMQGAACAGAGAGLFAATPADSLSGGMRPPAAAACQEQQQQQEEELPAAQQPSPTGDSSCSQASLASSTPAAQSQRADMRQLMQQVQGLLLAATPEAAAAGSPRARAQQHSEPGKKEGLSAAAAAAAASTAEDTLADVSAAEEETSTRQPRPQRQKQQKQQKQDHRKQDRASAAAEEADAGAAAGSTAAAAGEEQRQQAQQQALAEQHYQAWLQTQAEAAATAELEALELAASTDAQLSPLQQMLKACGQPVCLQNIPQMRDFLADVVDLRDVVKIGEGTYGEAFKSGQVVLKFVPMEGPNLINGWPQKGAADLLGEALIARALTDLGTDTDESGAPHASYTDAFVQTHRVGVCRGPYPPAFVKAWRAWDKRHKSENDFVGGLPDSQLYAVFAMANCGRDLESYQLTGYEQVRSMMLQTALALAVAEEALAFEHRDLHWGNIMLSAPQSTHVAARLKGCTIRVHAEGARVRLIDFTASRLQTPGGDVVFCDLEGEDGLFDGPKGKPQFETYRRMRKLTCKDWSGSHPGTNVLWLLYLTELLLSTEKPVPGASAGQKRALREFKKRLGSYTSCSDVIWDELFEGLWATG